MLWPIPNFKGSAFESRLDRKIVKHFEGFGRKAFYKFLYSLLQAFKTYLGSFPFQRSIVWHLKDLAEAKLRRLYL